MVMVFDLLSFVLGAVAAVSSQVVYHFVAKQLASVKAAIAANKAAVEAKAIADKNALIAAVAAEVKKVV